MKRLNDINEQVFDQKVKPNKEINRNPKSVNKRSVFMPELIDLICPIVVPQDQMN